MICPFLRRTGGAGIAGETRKALAATRTHALTHARPRPAGRQARVRTRPASAPEARALSGLCCGVGGGGCCCESPSACACWDPDASAALAPPPSSLTSVSAPRSEGRNGARLAKPERTAGCLRHRPASLRGPGSVLGDSAGRRRRRLPVGGVTLPSASPFCPALQGPRGLGGCPFGSALFVSRLELQRSGRGLWAEAAAPPAPSCPRAETSGIR